MSFTPLRATSTSLLAGLLRRQPTTAAKVSFAWRMATGDALARASRVRWTDEGTLHAVVDDPSWRRELRRARPLLLERLRGLLGEDVVVRIVIADPDSHRSSRPDRHA